MALLCAVFLHCSALLWCKATLFCIGITNLRGGNSATPLVRPHYRRSRDNDNTVLINYAFIARLAALRAPWPRALFNDPFLLIKRQITLHRQHFTIDIVSDAHRLTSHHALTHHASTVSLANLRNPVIQTTPLKSYTPKNHIYFDLTKPRNTLYTQGHLLNTKCNTYMLQT